MLQKILLLFVSIIWASLMNFRWHFENLQKKSLNGLHQVLLHFVSMIWANLMNSKWGFGYLKKKNVSRL
jgi:Na+/H+ antiporter NhaC